MYSRKCTILAAAGAALLSFAAAGCSFAAASVDQEIVTAIGTMDKNAAVLWTKDGRPKVGAIEAAMGRDISGADRDLAWAAYQACEPTFAEIAGLEASVAGARNRVAEARNRVEEAQARTRALSTRAERAAAERDEWRSKARAASSEAQTSAAEARAALSRASTAQAKTRELLAGRRVCLAERAAVAAELDDWLTSGLRSATRDLLDCLGVGEV